MRVKSPGSVGMSESTTATHVETRKVEPATDADAGIVQSAIRVISENYRRCMRIAIILAALIIYHTIIVLAWISLLYYKLLKPSSLAKQFSEAVSKLTQCCLDVCGKTIFKVALGAVALLAVAALLIWDTRESRHRLSGLAGMAFLLLFMLLFSKNPARVNWRPVIFGFIVQILVAILILRWDYGARKFNEFVALILSFLHFSEVGSNFVYGFTSDPPKICDLAPVPPFSVIQVIIYFGAVVSLFYYYGVIQFVLKKLAWLMQCTLGTTACESLNACACMFLGIAESPLLIRPYLERMTTSELHALLTSGFSCIAGALFATFISFGACPNYLLSSCIMSAPGALAVAKLLYPECEESALRRVEDLELAKGEESTPLEAISNGAVAAVEITLAIAANLVAFLSLLSLINGILLYCGQLVGMSGWSLELFFGYMLFPLAYLMGVTVSHAETMHVAQLMGTKTVLADFIAYKQMGELVDKGELSARSAMIATYALCGFSNFMSVAAMMGILGSMMPRRKAVIAKVAMRTLLAGTICCFYTAALAGVLIDTPVACKSHSRTTQCFDVRLAHKVFNPPSNSSNVFGALATSVLTNSSVSRTG